MSDQTIFVNIESGARATVEKVGERYADIKVRTKEGRDSRFSMPIDDYDGTSPNAQRHFSALWRPANPDDLLAPPNPDYRPPANMVAAMVDAEPADGRVQISPELD